MKSSYCSQQLKMKDWTGKNDFMLKFLLHKSKESPPLKKIRSEVQLISGFRCCQTCLSHTSVSCLQGGAHYEPSVTWRDNRKTPTFFMRQTAALIKMNSFNKLNITAQLLIQVLRPAVPNKLHKMEIEGNCSSSSVLNSDSTEEMEKFNFIYYQL